MSDFELRYINTSTEEQKVSKLLQVIFVESILISFSIGL